MLETWRFTVAALMKSSMAMSLLLRPATSSRRT
jgi:hypothetical protein